MSEKNNRPVEGHLQALELELLRPDGRKSPELLSSLLADDFTEFGSSGRIFRKQDIIEALRAEPPGRFSVSDLRVKILGGGVALVTYRAVTRDEANYSESASLRSSLWVINDGRWQMLFHQGTKIQGN
jgi:hypothetical protein